MRSAYSLSTIERTVQYFMKTLCYLVDSETSLKDSILSGGKEDSHLKDIFETYDTCKDHEMLLGLIQYYLVKDIEVDEDRNENGEKQTNLSHSLYNHVKLRIFCLELLNKLFLQASVDYE